ncbi:MAG: Flp pilus assembly protein CpaB [Planctomycetota bacterium]
MKAKVALIVAIVLAILAAVAVRAWLTRKEEERIHTYKTVKVLVARQPIKKGQEVTGPMLGTREMPVEALGREDQMILAREMETVVGQKVKKSINANDVLYQSDFTEGARRAEITESLPDQGRVIMAVPVDKVSGVAGHLLPDSVVDVVATRNVRDAAGKTMTETRTVLSGVRVVAVDLQMRRPEQFLSWEHRRDYASYSTALLSVSHREANLLAYLTQAAKIHLAVRRPTDPSLEAPTTIGVVNTTNLEEKIKEAAAERAAAARARAEDVGRLSSGPDE